MLDDRLLTEVLSDFARTLLLDVSVQGVLDELVLSIASVLDIGAVGVSLRLDGTGSHYVASTGYLADRYDEIRRTVVDDEDASGFTDRIPMVIEDLEADQRCPAFSARALTLGVRSAFSFPLWYRDSFIGSLDMLGTSTRSMDERDIKVSMTLADVVTAYVVNATKCRAAAEELSIFRHLARHDQLTGLANRFQLQERIDLAGTEGRDRNRNTAILFTDLDDFKSVNDLHGHAVGDSVLAAVAARLAKVVRNDDLLVRFSGDEFVILCENLDHANDAEVLVERIRRCFDEPFVVPGSDAVLNLTASTGVSFVGESGGLGRDLLELADAAMYRAKRDKAQ